ncbi:MAG TPA: hypothetical protein VGN48_03545 [Pedococcus sp.]|nr:hypothetical protein [Pedococcus sp.]
MWASPGGPLWPSDQARNSARCLRIGGQCLVDLFQKHSWTATPNLLDTWANPASTNAALTVTQNVFDGTTTTFTITAGTGVGPQLTAAIANSGQVSISLTATGIQTFTITNAR